MWKVIKVLEHAPGFGFDFWVYRGMDNTRPNETKSQLLNRLCKRFECKRQNIKWEVVDV